MPTPGPESVELVLRAPEPAEVLLVAPRSPVVPAPATCVLIREGRAATALLKSFFFR